MPIQMRAKHIDMLQEHVARSNPLTTRTATFPTLQTELRSMTNSWFALVTVLSATTPTVAPPEAPRDAFRKLGLPRNVILDL